MRPKTFWQSIFESNYNVPENESVEDLTEELLSYIGSPDPELRDDIAYNVYAHWLKWGMYSKDMVHAQVNQLLANLESGIGEVNTDSVFLRSFSALFLAEIVHNDNRQPFLKKTDVTQIFEKALWYLNAEKDLRGYVSKKGWAHSAAHTSDLLFDLARNGNLRRVDLERILQALEVKLMAPADWVYMYGETDRMARPVIAIFERKIMEMSFIQEWLDSFVNPKDRSWIGTYSDRPVHTAFHNVNMFLRCLYIQLRQAEGIWNRDELSSVIMKAIQEIRQF